MRRPMVYLWVILPLLILGAVVVYSAVAAYAAWHAMPVGAVPPSNGLLIALPTFLLWIPLALVLANVIVNAVPPLRRTAENYAAEAGRPSYSESQRQLLKLLGWSAFVCIPAIAVGWLV